MEQTQRKIFNFDDLSNIQLATTNCISNSLNKYKNTISACGCLFYHISKEHYLEFLLIKYQNSEWPRLDDLGGKIDVGDNTIFDAINREVKEETNEKINFSDHFQGEYQSFYNKKSKYYCIAIELDEDAYSDTSIFGDLEITDNIGRTIKWYKYDEFSHHLAYRLFYCANFMSFFNQLRNKINDERYALSQLPKWIVNEAKSIIKKYNIDSSHGLNHFIKTWLYTKQILQEEFVNQKVIENMSVEDGHEVALLSAFIHDRVDSKYMNVEDELNLFRSNALINGLSAEKVDAIIYIISHMSYSKRIQRRKNGLPLIEDTQYKIALGIVIDADQLEGYSIDRVLTYQSVYYRNCEEPEKTKMIKGWCKTIFVKRILKFKDEFMNTETGKLLCIEKHNKVEKYVNENLEHIDMFEY